MALKTSFLPFLLTLGGVHKLRLQEEGGRWSKKSTFCKHLYHRKCKRRGVGGQKKPNLVNVVCERPLTQWVEILSEAGDIIMVNGFILEKNVPGREKENRWSCLRLAYKIAQLIRTISTQIGLNSSGKSQMAPTFFFLFLGYLF